MACFTGIFQNKIQLFLTSEHRFLECDADALPDVRTFHRTVAAPAACSASSKQIAENIAEDITEISTVKVKSPESSGTACAAFKCRMTKLIVLTPFIRIAQYCICF